MAAMSGRATDWLQIMPWVAHALSQLESARVVAPPEVSTGADQYQFCERDVELIRRSRFRFRPLFFGGLTTIDTFVGGLTGCGRNTEPPYGKWILPSGTTSG